MIIVRVELHSAITGKVTEIARMGIANIGGTREIGKYLAETYRGRSAHQLSRRIRQRRGMIKDYPRLRIHVWHLVARALIAMNYAGEGEAAQAPDLLDAMGTSDAG
jgi:hypothetical protein